MVFLLARWSTQRPKGPPRPLLICHHLSLHQPEALHPQATTHLSLIGLWLCDQRARARTGPSAQAHVGPRSFPKMATGFSLSAQTTTTISLEHRFTPTQSHPYKASIGHSSYKSDVSFRFISFFFLLYLSLC